MKNPIANHQAPENTQTPSSNPERGVYAASVCPAFRDRNGANAAVRRVASWLLLFGASLVLGYWCLVLIV